MTDSTPKVRPFIRSNYYLDPEDGIPEKLLQKSREEHSSPEAISLIGKCILRSPVCRYFFEARTVDVITYEDRFKGNHKDFFTFFVNLFNERISRKILDGPGPCTDIDHFLRKVRSLEQPSLSEIKATWKVLVRAYSSSLHKEIMGSKVTSELLLKRVSCIKIQNEIKNLTKANALPLFLEWIETIDRSMIDELHFDGYKESTLPEILSLFTSVKSITIKNCPHLSILPFTFQYLCLNSLVLDNYPAVWTDTTFLKRNIQQVKVTNCSHVDSGYPQLIHPSTLNWSLFDLNKDEVSRLQQRTITILPRQDMAI